LKWDNSYSVVKLSYSQTCLQRPPLGPQKSGRCTELAGLYRFFQLKLVLKVAWPDLGWPLLTGGRYSEVAVNTGLTVILILNLAINIIISNDTDKVFWTLLAKKG
jgi:hypothetical protein